MRSFELQTLSPREFDFSKGIIEPLMFNFRILFDFLYASRCFYETYVFLDTQIV